jgi:transcription termination factor Rho
MSDTEATPTQAELPETEPAPKPARKRTARKRTATQPPQAEPAQPEAADSSDDKPVAKKAARKGRPRKADAAADAAPKETASEPQASPSGEQEVFSASPDDLENEHRQRRQSADDQDSDKPGGNRRSAENQQNTRDERPRDERPQRQRNQRGGGNQDGGGSDRGPRGKRFQKDKGKQNRPEHRQGKFAKGNKKNKRPQWQSDFAAANEDDVDPPSFEQLLGWDVLVSATTRQEFLAEAIDPQQDAFDYNELYGLKLAQLAQRAKEDGIETTGSPSRAKILKGYLQQAAQAKRAIKARGLLEVAEEGFGFLVFPEESYRLKTDSPFLAPTFIQQLGLGRGHWLEVLLHLPREGESCPPVVQIDSVMGRPAEEIQGLTPFKELTAYYPTERIILEAEQGGLKKWDNISMRIVDLLSPVGLGQRGLIVAPPRTGKTVLLQGIANSIRVNKPEAKLIILLVDERPEEVTDFKRSVDGAEIIASTFDESAESHVHAAEMVIEKARRMVECQQDVIILLDSITRLARAYNTMMPSSGKILSGGVEAGALQLPKRFFGSARNVEEGGSLTILGTALVETGSKMDEVIFEEFKGTGNMELHLDRELSNKRVFPSLSFEKSGTRKEEILYHPDEMAKVHALRRAMKGVPSVEAMEMLIQRIKKTETNAVFLMGMQR